MAFYKAQYSISSVILLVFVSVPSNAQQSGFQLSLLSPAASGGALSTLGISADIVETHNESYLKSLERMAGEKAGEKNKTFQPSASDLLVEQAEERFNAGRKFYRVNDTDRARTEFDAAVDLMIQASAN